MTEYFKLMRKFSHLNETEIEDFQQLVNKRYSQIKALTTLGNGSGSKEEPTLSQWRICALRSDHGFFKTPGPLNRYFGNIFHLAILRACADEKDGKGELLKVARRGPGRPRSFFTRYCRAFQVIERCVLRFQNHHFKKNTDHVFEVSLRGFKQTHHQW